MRGKRIEEKLLTLTNLTHRLVDTLEAKNNVITQQNEIIKQQRDQLDKVMDRLMSRNFQELATFSPVSTPTQDFVLPELEEMLVGSISDPSDTEQWKPGKEI